MKKLPLLLAFFILQFISAGISLAQGGSTPSWIVIDGDTIKQGERVIRLWGIDAPEINQRCLDHKGNEYKCGLESKFALETLIKDDPLICEFINKDRYGRDVAKCFHDGTDVGGLMVSLGQAVEYQKYSKGYYKTEQATAHSKALGIWSGQFEVPEEYRKNKKGI